MYVHIQTTTVEHNNKYFYKISYKIEPESEEHVDITFLVVKYVIQEKNYVNSHSCQFNNLL